MKRFFRDNRSQDKDLPSVPPVPEDLPETTPLSDEGTAASARSGSTPVEPLKPVKRKPSLGQRLLRWALGLLVIFSLGALVVFLWLYLPLQRQAEQRQVELQSAQQRIQELETQVADMSGLQTANEGLQTDLQQMEAHIALLTARADIATARTALLKEDPAKARLTLSKTGESLAKIEGGLPANQQPVVADLQSRLELAISEIGENDFAAESDLDVLEKGLLELETALIR